MKTKVIETGKVINVKWNPSISPLIDSGAKVIYDGDDGKQYTDLDLDFNNLYPDWQKIKIRASIAAMQGFIANDSFYADNVGPEDTAKRAEEFADALINRLKETI